MVIIEMADFGIRLQNPIIPEQMLVINIEKTFVDQCKFP